MLVSFSRLRRVSMSRLRPTVLCLRTEFFCPISLLLLFASFDAPRDDSLSTSLHGKENATSCRYYKLIHLAAVEHVTIISPSPHTQWIWNLDWPGFSKKLLPERRQNLRWQWLQGSSEPKISTTIGDNVRVRVQSMWLLLGQNYFVD